MTHIIWIINFLSAVMAIVGWLKRPERKFLAITGLICGLISVVTAQYTITSVVFLSIFLCLVILIFSVRSYAEFEKHIVQAEVLFNGPTKRELIGFAKRVIKKPAITPIVIAQGVEEIARMGEKYSNAGELIDTAYKLSVALSCDFIKCIKLLVKLKRYFNFKQDYEQIADKLCVAASKGVQVDEVNQVFDEFKQECVFPKNISIDEFLAMLTTLKRSGVNGNSTGIDLAIMVNELIEAQLSGKFNNERTDRRS